MYALFKEEIIEQYSQKRFLTEILDINEKENKKEESILNQALQSMSFIDENENFYHGYMLEIFVNFLNREYIVKSNREAGRGRFDIMIKRIDRKLGIIVDFKVAKENENL